MAEQQPVAQSSNMAQAKLAPTYGKSALRVSYKVPFSVRLRYTLSSIAHFFRMTSQSTHFQSKEFKPLNNVYRVDSYRDYLCLLYAKPKNANLSREHWKVTEINTYKDQRTTVRHEYLIANLSDGKGGTVFLRIERRLQDSSAKAFGKAIMGRGSGSRSNSGPAPQSNTDSDSQDGATTTVNDGKKKKFKKNAVDEVTLFDPTLPKNQEEMKNQKLVERIVFAPDHQIPLPKLVVLACAINDHSREYHFFEKNCYWFCYCAVEALKQRHKGEPQPVNGKQASWRGLPTGHLWDEIDFEQLLNKFDFMWGEFDREVSFFFWIWGEDGPDVNEFWQIDEIVNNPHNVHIKKAKEQAEEERKQKEEAEYRAKESDRRAEEERKRAEELERQLAELKAQLASKGNVLTNT